MSQNSQPHQLTHTRPQGQPQREPQQSQQKPSGQLEPRAQHLPAPVRRQGAWTAWWLILITLGIYYFVWYQRVNKELAARLGVRQGARGQWWSQLIPIMANVGLHRTAKRVNAAHAAIGSPTRIGTVTTWLWAPIWFMSQTRYVQRRMNLLHDIAAAS